MLGNVAYSNVGEKPISIMENEITKVLKMNAITIMTANYNPSIIFICARVVVS
jgi:hypothetical protein